VKENISLKMGALRWRVTSEKKISVAGDVIIRQNIGNNIINIGADRK